VGDASEGAADVALVHHARAAAVPRAANEIASP
jgi:hypothetical protein